MSDDKKYPAASKGIGDLLNLSGESTSNKESHGIEEVMPPENLPIPQEFLVSQPELTPADIKAEEVIKEKDAPKSTDKVDSVDVQDLLGIPHQHNQAEVIEKPRPVFINVLIKLVPYLIVFGIGFAIFVFFLPDFSVTNLVDRNRLKLQDLVTKDTHNALDELQKNLASEYDEWMQQFFAEVTDPEITNMNVDVSGNGLTNFEKFLFDLNPKVYSTRGQLGDGELILKGINPWTGVELTAEQKELVSKYINPEVVNNRIAGAITNKMQDKFARYVDPQSPYYTSNIPQNSYIAPSTGLPQISFEEQVNFNVPAQIDLPTIGVSAPLIWTRNVANFDSDLKKGVVHYPGTASPGEVGTSYISGHSSGYAWDRNPYKEIFAGLGRLNTGDNFTITLQKNNGQRIKYYYQADRRGEFAPNDQAQFASGPNSVVALSTCWPVGTTDKRLVIFGTLQSAELLP